MNTHDILIAIDAEISKLQQAKALLSGLDTITKRKPGRPGGITLSTSKTPFTTSAKPTAGRTLSADARAKIAAGQKKRWAKFKRAAKKIAAVPVSKATPNKKAAKTKPTAASSSAS